MSKNNLYRYRQMQPQQQRFALRKLTVGVASVLLGTTFLVGAAQADTTNVSGDVTTATSSVPTTDETASATASLGGTTTSIDGRNVMAQNDSVQVKATYRNVHYDAGQRIKVSYSDSAKWNVVGWASGEAKILGDNAFIAVNNGDGSFTVKSTRTMGESDSGFDLNFSLQYKDQVSAATPTTLTVTIAHDDNAQSVITSNEFTPTIIPYFDRVQSEEIAHGWAANATKSVNNNDDNARTILDGTSATLPHQDRKLMQYMVEWNYGKAGNTDGSTLAPLDAANFTARFSRGQTLLPDTIKVFRVYQPDAVAADGGRIDISSVYSKITKTDPSTGQFLYEDTAFEQFLKDHLTVTTTDNDGQTSDLSWNDYQTALARAKQDHTEPPLVNGIHLDESDMHHVKLSTDPAGQTHNFAENSGDNTDETVATPHSTFFIQMDTLLDQNMPIEWTKAGDGPTIAYNTTSGDFKGVGIKIDRSVSPVFNGGGNGFNNPNPYAAQLHFADVSDTRNVISLDSGHGVSPLSGQDQESALENTVIKFIGAEDAIKTLQDAGYTLVGASYGNKTSGAYTGSDLANNDEYNSYHYGKYGDTIHGEYDANNALIHNFTLNFTKPTTPDTPPTTPDTPPTTPETPPTTPDTPPTTPDTPSTTPSEPVIPEEPSNPTSTPTVTPKPTVTSPNNQQPTAIRAQRLPQTGNQTSVAIAALGIVLGMFGLGLVRKKNN